MIEKFKRMQASKQARLERIIKEFHRDLQRAVNKALYGHA